MLVVEDEPLVCELAAEVLGMGGFRTLTAADAHAGLDILRTEPVDLLFTDIDLAQGTSGLLLAAEARRLRPDVAVVYASGGRAELDRALMVPRLNFSPNPTGQPTSSARLRSSSRPGCRLITPSMRPDRRKD